MRTRARAHTQQQSATCNNSQHVNEMPASNGVQAPRYCGGTYSSRCASELRTFEPVAAA